MKYISHVLLWLSSEHMIPLIIQIIQSFSHLDKVPPLRRKFISLSTHMGAGTQKHVLSLPFAIKYVKIYPRLMLRI